MLSPADSSWVSTATEWAGLSESILTCAAIIAGGLWAYFKYFKGRTFHERLETEIEGELTHDGATRLMRVVVRLKNVGLAKVPISQKGTALDIQVCRSCSPDAERAVEADWSFVATVSLFEDHQLIEPGESIQDHTLFALPSNSATAVRLKSTIASQKQQWPAGAVLFANSPPSTDA